MQEVACVRNDHHPGAGGQVLVRGGDEFHADAAIGAAVQVEGGLSGGAQRSPLPGCIPAGPASPRRAGHLGPGPWHSETEHQDPRRSQSQQVGGET